jgi:hypothetical protein
LGSGRLETSTHPSVLLIWLLNLEPLGGDTFASGVAFWAFPAPVESALIQFTLGVVSRCAMTILLP